MSVACPRTSGFGTAGPTFGTVEPGIVTLDLDSWKRLT
jgi:hypothetical protein